MLKKLLKDFNLNSKQLEQLNELRDLCLEYNKHTNLTSIREENEFNVKHILDSLSVLKFRNMNNKNILDVGSGGGFPGLVLAIALPNSHITMLDSSNKKIEYIKYAIRKLNIKNASTIHSRVEDSNTNEKFDIVVSRAVSALNILLEITAFSVRINGELILYKGSNIDAELPKDWNIISKLGLSFNEIYNFELDKKTIRKIIFFTKKKSTNILYPRAYSTIKKMPIF